MTEKQALEIATMARRLAEAKRRREGQALHLRADMRVAGFSRERSEEIADVAVAEQDREIADLGRQIASAYTAATGEAAYYA